MTYDTLSEKIDAWLDGKMPPEVAARFEAEMAADQSIVQEVQAHRLERLAVNELLKQKFKADMAAWDENPDEWPAAPEDQPPIVSGNPATKKLNRLWWLLLLLLCTGGLYLFFIKPSIETGKEQVPEKTEPLPATKSETSPSIPVATEMSIEKPPTSVPPISDKKFVQIEKKPKKHHNATSSEELPSEQPDAGSFEPNIANTLNKIKEDAKLAEVFASLDDDLPPNFQSEIMDPSRALRAANEPDDAWTKDIESGKLSYKKGRFLAAEKQLLKIPADANDYADAQFMLADIYHRNHKAHNAAICFERYVEATQKEDDKWRLLLFYLHDYAQSKEKFWEKLKVMVERGSNTNKQKALKLRDELGKRGIVE
jgi:hypothetical protein